MVILISFFILSLLQSVAIFQGKYYDHTDSGLSNYVFGILLSPWVATLFYAVIFFASMLAIYLVALKILKGKPYAMTLAFFAAVMYTLFFFPQYGPSHNLNAMLLPVALLLTIMTVESLDALLVAVTAVFMAFVVFIGGVYIIPIGIICGLVGLFLLSERKKQDRFEVACTLYIIFIMASIVAVWLYAPALASLHSNLIANNKIAALNSNIILQNYNHQTIFTALQVVGVNQESELIQQYASNNPLAVASQTIIAGIALISAGFLLFRKQKDNDTIIKGIFIALILLVFAFMDFGLPTLIQSNPILFLLGRASEPIYYFAISFCEVLLFIFSISGLLQMTKNTAVRATLMFFILGLILIHFAYFDSIELQAAQPFQIPNYAFQTAAYINTHNTNHSNVAILPAQFPFGYYTTYYYGTNIYAYLINASVRTGGYTLQRNLTPVLIPSARSIGYGLWARRLGNQTIKNRTEVATTMCSYGIGYIILEKDAVPTYTNFSIPQVSNNLNQSANLSLIQQFNQTAIYKISCKSAGDQ